MAKLTITLEVDDVDPTLTDPHDVAEDIMDVYAEEARVGNANYNVRFLAGDHAAEWRGR